jgi:energy-coupling factor transporter ATP-binding protein EcfA2
MEQHHYSAHKRKKIFPHRYSKRFYGFALSKAALWHGLLERLRKEKDAMVLVTGDTGSGKSHFVGNMCFKFGENEDNFILKDNTKMFTPEENFIVDPDEFAFKMINKTGAVLWGDEFRRSANRRDWYSKINKTIVDRKNTNRKLFNIYFLCLPYEREFDDALAAHLHVWIWIRRGVGEVYCKISGIKGGSGLNIKKILEREDKYLLENPNRSIIPPTIHPEYIGRVYFPPLSKKLKKKYDDLVQKKKAVGDLTEEEKIKYGIEIVKTPEEIIKDAINSVKSKGIQTKMDLWNAVNELEGDEASKLKKLNFYLKLEFGKTFEKMFVKKKEDDISW